MAIKNRAFYCFKEFDDLIMKNLSSISGPKKERKGIQRVCFTLDGSIPSEYCECH